MHTYNLTFDRTNSIRQKRTHHTYMNKFITEWNILPNFLRKKLRFANSLKACKEILKKERTLKYDNKIHHDYKWKSFKN